MTTTEKIRCPWANGSDLEAAYHDAEWGVPCHDDAVLFEFLTLEAAQAGLSWSTILRKREGYRHAFAGFDASRVAAFTQSDVDRLVLDAGIVRHRKKIESAVANARLFLDIQARHGSFDSWLWNFVEGKPIVNAWTSLEQIPAVTPLAEQISRTMKKEGFSFLGPTIVYAFMQAVGMVNDHLVTCFRYAEA